MHVKNISRTSCLIMEYLAPTSFTTLLSFTASLLVLAIILFYFIQSHKNVKKHPLPPGPKRWPIVGCLPTMLRNKPVYRWIHNLMKEMNTQIACICLGNVHVIPVICPDIACEFLKAQDNTFASRPNTMTTDLISRGYLTTALSPSRDLSHPLESSTSRRPVLVAGIDCWGLSVVKKGVAT